MGDTSGCQISSNNLAVYLQGVSVEPSSNLTSEYFVTASLPSSTSLRRVWQFTTQGTVKGPDTATLTLDYTQAHENCPEYNITFEGALNGTLTVKNQVFSANKFISYSLVSTYVLVLTLKIPKSIQKCFGPGTTQNYSFSVYLNDATTSSCGTNYTITPFTGSADITITRFPDTTSDSDTFYYCVVGGGGAGASASIVNEYYYGGGGGGGGQVTTGSVQLSSSEETWTLTVGQDSSGNGNPSSIVDQSGNVIASAAGGQVGSEYQESSNNNNGGESGSGVPGGQGGCNIPGTNNSGAGGGGGGDVSGGVPSCTMEITTGGDGGAGYLWSCNLVNYGGGGGGGGANSGIGGIGGSGGSGGGGNGGSSISSTGEAGTSNTGGGGGGGYCEGNYAYSGGNGASGIILLSYDPSGYYITA